MSDCICHEQIKLDHLNIRWQWLATPVSAAVLPAHVYLFNVLDVIRVEGDNASMLGTPVSVAASFTGF